MSDHVDDPRLTKAEMQQQQQQDKAAAATKFANNGQSHQETTNGGGGRDTDEEEDHERQFAKATANATVQGHEGNEAVLALEEEEEEKEQARKQQQKTLRSDPQNSAFTPISYLAQQQQQQLQQQQQAYLQSSSRSGCDLDMLMPKVVDGSLTDFGFLGQQQQQMYSGLQVATPISHAWGSSSGGGGGEGHYDHAQLGQYRRPPASAFPQQQQMLRQQQHFNPAMQQNQFIPVGRPQAQQYGPSAGWSGGGGPTTMAQQQGWQQGGFGPPPPGLGGGWGSGGGGGGGGRQPPQRVNQGYQQRSRIFGGHTPMMVPQPQSQSQYLPQQQQGRRRTSQNGDASNGPLDSMRGLEQFLPHLHGYSGGRGKSSSGMGGGNDDFDESNVNNSFEANNSSGGGLFSSSSSSSPRSLGSSFSSHQQQDNNGEKFSRKVFVGGLPPDIDEEEITASFRRFGPLVVDWPHKAESKSYFPPKGYAFLLFQDELSVQALIDTCIQDEDKFYLCVSSPTIRDKPVQVRPWRLADADFVLDATLPLDPRRTVFVGGVPRPLKGVELATIMDRLYGGVCYAGIDTDPELRYPKGAGRVAFASQQSYIAAISARFVQLQHGEIDKRVEVKPYVLDDQLCDECQGARCAGKFAPFFCANVTCLQYYCEQCWSAIHSRPGREYHKPLVKEGADRPRTVPFRWS